MSAPDFMPVLSAGAHSSPKRGACVMEYVSWLAGEAWSDHPPCTHPVLAAAARAVNDALADSERQRLVPLIGRLIDTADTRADETQRRVLSVRLAVRAARYTQGVVSTPAACQRAIDAAQQCAIEAAEQWADNPTAANAEHAEATATAAAAELFVGVLAVGIDAAVDAAYAAGADSHADRDTTVEHFACTAMTGAAAVKLATAGDPDTAPDDLIGLLTALLDEHQRLTETEGLVPRPDHTGLDTTPDSGGDHDQRWFWTDEWQIGEREASAYIAAGETTVYDSKEELLAALDILGQE